MKIYTDGSCITGKIGGYCAIVVDENNQETIISGGALNTTNNIMELTAIYEGLKSLPKKRCTVLVESDSTYAIGVSSGNFKANKNQDIVAKIRNEVSKHDVEFTWVKGHSDNPMNEKCDKIACKESNKLKPTKTAKISTSQKKHITIGISGHRDKIADWNDIRTMLEWYSLDNSLTVIHGGADGFDTQVSRVIKRLNTAYGYSIKEVVIRPDYKNTENKKFAPLKRNEQIVDNSDVLVALWDGRTTGGTYYTIQYAEKNEKDVYYLNIKEDE